MRAHNVFSWILKKDVSGNPLPIDYTWAWKAKPNEKGEIDKFKARLCARGFREIFGVHYTETFAPVTTLTSGSATQPTKMDWFQIQLQMAPNRSIWPVGVHRTHPNRFGACGAPSWVCAGLRLVIWCGGGLTGTGTREQTKRRRFLLCRLVVAGQRHGYTNQLHGRSMCQNVGPTSHDGTDNRRVRK